MEAVELKLRTEQPADYRETENVTREAFWNLYSPGCCEHYLLHVMREDVYKRQTVPANPGIERHPSRPGAVSADDSTISGFR